ncbi:N-acetyltransferase [Clostridium sp. LIBA-8841]|uniref:N-acetyltransferase n=1 Tax=Clostridium sp. LIBA-8841 TaxID=2987530 RepID=UPI002AC43429|nr:N-acetyltransferase [Clostridium sp. LIBA-8841]MDZ5254105.1 N-acetyltransferase [Clostridium sp. LIBA-8841]
MEEKIMVEIKELRREEIDEIMRIWLESTIKAHDFIEKEYWEKNYNVVKEVYIPMAETFVYYEDKKIKGFISIINKEFIGALFVDVESQGLGIGSKLLDFVKLRYKNISLAVYKMNEKAVKFYINNGFKIIKEQENEDSGFVEYIMKS